MYNSDWKTTSKPASEFDKSEFNIRIPGKPIAKQRPRFCRTGRYVQTYDVQKDEVRGIKYLLVPQMRKIGLLKPLDSILELDLTFHTPMPSTWSRKRQNENLGKYDQRRPDLDNYVKLYCDAMNSIVYRDDALVVSLTCKKIFSNNPRVEIQVKVLGDCQNA